MRTTSVIMKEKVRGQATSNLQLPLQLRTSRLPTSRLDLLFWGPWLPSNPSSSAILLHDISEVS
jgi:hypothetical protein